MPAWIQQFHTAGNEAIDPATGLLTPFITNDQSSLIVSILSAGTFFGALSAAPAGDLLGRRFGLVLSNAIFCVGVILQTASADIPVFVAGRFFAGFGVGQLSALVPLYQSETAPKWIRGVIVGAYQLAITIGLLLAAIVDNATKGRSDSGAYRIPIAVQFAWAIILVAGLLILPETPRYLIKTGKMDKAARALSRLRRLDIGHPAIASELQEIVANHEYELSFGQSSYIDCFKGGMFKRLATGCLLQSLQQLTGKFEFLPSRSYCSRLTSGAGVNFIFYYGTSYFTNAGFTNPFITTMITSAVNVASTFPGLYMVETWGRRNLLLFGGVGMCVCQFIVAITGTVTAQDNQAAQNAAISFICIYIFFFACSWGPVAWIVTGEIFPLKVRAKCLSMTTASNWLLNFAIAYATPYLVNNNPNQPPRGVDLKSKIFFIWGGCCFICILFVWAMIYETKGLSLEQVDELYDKVAVAWKSPGFKPTVSFQEVQDVNAGARKMSLVDAESEAIRKKSVSHEEAVEPEKTWA
ncbi:hypothetical protein FH972_022497 [Carpinus fangiana]|uniref:Major facilitator superfamily (MFS) profile domain-containing protein n=1 Tax=Carpinus fangiana TaxID=176857 RepID=A0A5N6KSR4_9ROSI|nr:hypothetical protein FH972_022497 [Carpinus fangiana]